MNKPILFFLLLVFNGLPIVHSASVEPSSSLEDRRFDVVVVGATPGGLATAIRASREGLSVLVVNHTNHIGGMLSTGLGVLDTEYYRARSPILDEMCSRIKAHTSEVEFSMETYVREHVGERLYVEPHVIENILNEMVRPESISFLLGHYPKAIIKKGKSIKSVRFQEMQSESSLLISGRYFADATYEGDLAALAGVPYRVGRESRDEFGEPSAGVHFSYLVDTGERPEIIQDLRIHKFWVSSREIAHPRSGEGDNAIQAYNFRPTLTNNPENRYIPPKPENYDPEAYQIIRERLSPLPDTRADSDERKLSGWNVAILPGGNHDYPTAGWDVRREIEKKHLDWMIGILHYLQKDLPEPVWGLARDEFVDNGHLPYEMYVREARRIQGMKIFTENDGLLSADYPRAPIHSGSIAITEWALDSHGCTTDRYKNSRPEGKVLLSETSVPGQVDFQCLLSPEATNLVVPVCLSSTHVGWGTIRLEPTWMHIGEAAGYALALASERDVDLINLDIDSLQRTLAENRILLTYFDDLEIIQPDAYIPAIQYFGTKGFFDTYNARADDLLDAATAIAWLEGLNGLFSNSPVEPNRITQLLNQSARKTPQMGGDDILVACAQINPELAEMLEVEQPSNSGPLTRAETCLSFYKALRPGH